MIYLLINEPFFFSGLIIILTLAMNDKVKFFTAVIGSYVWGPIIELSFVGYLNHMFLIVMFFST